MLFVGKSAQQLTEADLANLIGVSRETEAVDFKEYAYPAPPDDQLPSDQKEKERIKNEWKISLCTDFSAMANANGGWIICGMKEQGGVATEICGLGSQLNAEREIARLGQAANSGIEPLIGGLDFGVIPLQDANQSVVIAIRIPKSFRIPHRVKLTRKFHVRRSGRNDEMSMDEIRAAYNFSDAGTHRVKNFRIERTNAIASGDSEEIPVVLSEGIRLVLHSIPLASVDSDQNVDLSVLGLNTPPQWAFRYYYNYGRFNIDGFVRPDGIENTNPEVSGYTQIYRSGIVEIVDNIPLANPPQDQLISLQNIEDSVLELVDRTLTTQKNLSVTLPLALMISILGIKGRRLVVSYDNLFDPFLENPLRPINRSNLLIADALIDRYDSDYKTVMKPAFDMLWNAGGWNRSKSYDDNGMWIRKPRH